MEVLEGFTELFGAEAVAGFLDGGLATPILVGVAVLLLFAAFRVVSLALRLLILLVMAGLVAGAAPWEGLSLPWGGEQEVTGPVAGCAVEEASAGLGEWEQIATKRIAVRSLSDDARCAEDGTLAAGSAEVVLRSLYDVPIGTRTVTGAT